MKPILFTVSYFKPGDAVDRKFSGFRGRDYWVRGIVESVHGRWGVTIRFENHYPELMRIPPRFLWSDWIKPAAA